MRLLRRGALAIALLLIVPVVVSQLDRRESRPLEAVALDQTVYREVVFENPAQSLSLAGMLFLPDGVGPFPAVAAIHGSGPSRRSNGWYLTVAQYLQASGVIVLLPDKRGSEKSEGQWQTASYQELATDTAAAVDFLRNLGPAKVNRIGLIGFSQGGRIAPIAASGMSGLDFIINIVGGALPAHQSLVYEETHNLREFGVLPGFAHVLAYPAAWSLIYIRQRDHWSAVGNFDPLPFWERVSAPSLVLYGSEDTNTNTRESVARLRSLQKDNMNVIVYPGSGHALEDPPGEGNNLFRRDALEDIREFIRLTQ
jgi:dipeptidyl aminopeptidase/acylaminoacyl peptidase